MRAEAVAQRREGRVSTASRTQPAPPNAEESVGRESEQQGFHHGNFAEGFHEYVGISGPPTDVHSLVAITAAHGLGLAGRGQCAALCELEVRRFLGAVALAEVQAATDSQAEDAVVASESESAE